MKRMMGMTAALFVLGIVAVGCNGETSVTVAAPDQSGISVNGTGEVQVEPDIGVISLGVEVTADSVETARTEAASAMDDVLESLRQNGIADEDIQTSFISIYPQYNFQENQAPQITGYSVSNIVTARVRELDQFSTVLDEAVAAGGDAIRVNSVGFEVDDPEQYLEEARAEAIAEARENAQQLADEAGVTLGSIRAVSESGGMPPFAPVAREAFDDAQAGGATPIQPGQQELTLSVQVVFAIE